MKLFETLIVLLLATATTARRDHKKRNKKNKRQKNLAPKGPKGPKEYDSEIDVSLIKKRSSIEYSWQWLSSSKESDVGAQVRAFGPKHKDQLCDTLTSEALQFDIDESEGLSWSEYYGFVESLVEAVEQHVGSRQLHFGNHSDSRGELGLVYHDTVCLCHYVYDNPFSCCVDDEEDERSTSAQITFYGLNLKGDDATPEDKEYRRNFCDGIMYLMQSEGIDLEAANDAILAHGLDVDVESIEAIDAADNNDVEAQGDSTVDASIVDATEDVTESEPIIEGTPAAETEEATSTETSDAGESELTVEESASTVEEITEESNSDATADSDNTVEVELINGTDNSEKSTEEAAVAEDQEIVDETEYDPEADTSTSAVVSLSTGSGIEEEESTSSNSNVAIGATIGVLFAALVAILVIVMAIIRRKRGEKNRVREFAGEEMVDDDNDAISVHNDVVAIDMGGEKMYAEITPESPTESGVSDDISVVSVDIERNEDCAQISFEEGMDGGFEAKVSTLAALGIASTVTSRLSTQPQQES